MLGATYPGQVYPAGFPGNVVLEAPYDPVARPGRPFTAALTASGTTAVTSSRTATVLSASTTSEE